MSLSRALARPLLSSIFIAGGADALLHPEEKVKKADQVARPIAAKLPGLPEDTATLVQINGAVMVGAGTLLALGKFRRLAAVALIGSILPTTYAGHRFWEETDDATRAQQRVHFLKNLGLLGGLILAAVDTEGSPSLTWRAKHARRGTGRAARRSAKPIGADLAKYATEGIQVAEELLSTVAKSSEPVIGHAEESAKKAVRRGKTKAGAVASAAAKSAKSGAPALDQARVVAADAAKRGKRAAAGAASAVKDQHRFG